MYIVGRLLTTMHSLQQEGTVQVERSIGAEGTVYNRISPGKMGKVQVTFQGSLRTENAVHDLDETLDYGRPIRSFGPWAPRWWSNLSNITNPTLPKVNDGSGER